MYKVTEINGYKQMAINPIPDKYVPDIQDDVMKLLGEKFPQKFGPDELAKDKVLGIFSKKNPDHKIFFDVRSNMQDPKTGIWHIPIYEQIKGLPVPVLDPDSGYQPLELQFKMPEPKEKVQLEEDLKRWKEISIYNEKRREENDFGRSTRLRLQQMAEAGDYEKNRQRDELGKQERVQQKQAESWKEIKQDLAKKTADIPQMEQRVKEKNWVEQAIKQSEPEKQVVNPLETGGGEKVTNEPSVEEINKKIDAFNAMAERGFSSEQAYIDAKNKMGLTDSLLEKYRRGR